MKHDTSKSTQVRADEKAAQAKVDAAIADAQEASKRAEAEQDRAVYGEVPAYEAIPEQTEEARQRAVYEAGQITTVSERPTASEIAQAARVDAAFGAAGMSKLPGLETNWKGEPVGVDLTDHERRHLLEANVQANRRAERTIRDMNAERVRQGGQVLSADEEKAIRDSAVATNLAAIRAARLANPLTREPILAVVERMAALVQEARDILK